MDDQQTTGTSGRKRFRKLRIAWSVVWGVACLLLVVLWVRSYTRREAAHIRFGNSHLAIVRSQVGKIVFWIDNENLPASALYSQAIPATSPPEAEIDAHYTRAWTGYGIRRLMWLKHSAYAVHYWIIAATILFLSAAPWFRWRFSLRTQLIATTLTAVGPSTR